MKLRIKGPTLRLRLTQGETRALLSRVWSRSACRSHPV